MSDPADDYSQDDRHGRHGRRRVLVLDASQAHRSHRGIVQSGDSHAALEDPRDQDPRRTECSSPQRRERGGRAEDAHHERQGDGRPVEQQRNRQTQAERSGVVRRPRPDPVGRRGTDEPGEPQPTAGRPHPFDQRARRVGAEDRDQDRQRDDALVARRGDRQVLGDHAPRPSPDIRSASGRGARLHALRSSAQAMPFCAVSIRPVKRRGGGRVRHRAPPSTLDRSPRAPANACSARPRGAACPTPP